VELVAVDVLAVGVVAVVVVAVVPVVVVGGAVVDVEDVEGAVLEVVEVGGPLVEVEEVEGAVVVVAPPQPAWMITFLQDALISPRATARFATRVAQLTYLPLLRAGQHRSWASARASCTPAPSHRLASAWGAERISRVRPSALATNLGMGHSSSGTGSRSGAVPCRSDNTPRPPKTRLKQVRRELRVASPSHLR
jgi:hypothetical protein